MHLGPDEELVLRIEKNELPIMSLKKSLHKAQALVQRFAKEISLVEILFTLRRENNSL